MTDLHWLLILFWICFFALVFFKFSNLENLLLRFLLFYFYCSLNCLFYYIFFCFRFFLLLFSFSFVSFNSIVIKLFVLFLLFFFCFCFRFCFLLFDQGFWRKRNEKYAAIYMRIWALKQEFPLAHLCCVLSTHTLTRLDDYFRTKIKVIAMRCVFWVWSTWWIRMQQVCHACDWISLISLHCEGCSRCKWAPMKQSH